MDLNEKLQRGIAAAQAGRKAEAHIEFFEALLERISVEGAGAFGEHVGHDARYAGQSRGLARGSAAPIGAQGQHRHRLVRHEPGFEAARRDDALNRNAARSLSLFRARLSQSDERRACNRRGQYKRNQHTRRSASATGYMRLAHTFFL